MDDNNLFIDGYKLPTPLSKEETSELFNKAKNGDVEAREKLAVHNIKLVLSVVESKFSMVPYEKADLVAIGNVGLVLAINNYDPSKGYEFSTFATHCIRNEILMFIRKIKREPFIDSLDRVVIDDGGKDIKLGDQISDEKILSDDIEEAEIYKIIDEIIENLPEMEKEIIRIRFGFSEKKCSQYELAKKYNISQPLVSKIARKTVQKIAKILEEKGIIDLGYTSDDSKKFPLKTIYEHFKEYSKWEIDEVIAGLNEDDKKILKARYGNDLNNPVLTEITKEEYSIFYGSLLGKMGRLLSKNYKSISIEDYIEKIFKDESFNEIIDDLNALDFIVLSLRYGYPDGICLSSEVVAKLLGIKKEEVIKITRNFLLKYKDKLNIGENITRSRIKPSNK